MRQSVGLRPRPARDGLSAGHRDALRRRAGVPRAGRVPLDPVVPRAGLRGQRDGPGAAEPGPPSLVGRAIGLLVPAVSNGMSAPLNDVALAAFGTAAIFAWTRLLDDRRVVTAAVVAGVVRRAGDRREVPGARAGRACSGGRSLICDRWLRAGCGGRGAALDRPRSASRAGFVFATAALVGGGWYLRAYVHTGNPGLSVLPRLVRRGRARRGPRPDQAAAGGHALEPADRRSSR